MRVLNNVTEAIGNTHMLHLSKIADEFGVQGNIYAKMEYLNPGFSKKDRVALQMITEAENAGLLVPGQAVVELTSGNTGTGLAIACACKGYKFIACMSKGNSMERARMMKALGAEIINRLLNNTKVNILGKQGSWYKIELNGQKGYVYGMFLNEGTMKENSSKTIANKKSEVKSEDKKEKK